MKTGQQGEQTHPDRENACRENSFNKDSRNFPKAVSALVHYGLKPPSQYGGYDHRPVTEWVRISNEGSPSPLETHLLGSHAMCSRVFSTTEGHDASSRNHYRYG
ncbi:hypothetical protein TNCV_4983731 [Trichonephila clavipes]|nr:hypothetical protein TNCV_4983731 [Trichonephila clavipes]